MRQILSQICISIFLHPRRHIGRTSICALDVIYMCLHVLRIFLYILYVYYKISMTYGNILTKFSAVQCISFFTIWARTILRVSYISHRYCSILNIYCTYRCISKKYPYWGKSSLRIGGNRFVILPRCWAPHTQHKCTVYGDDASSSLLLLLLSVC